MEAFVRSVVLGMPGTASLQIDPQRHPPRRESAQSKKSPDTGEGRAVIASDRSRQPLPLKNSLNTFPHRLAPCILQRAHFEHVATMLIAHRQRLTTLAPAS